MKKYTSWSSSPQKERAQTARVQQMGALTTAASAAPEAPGPGFGTVAKAAETARCEENFVEIWVAHVEIGDRACPAVTFFWLALSKEVRVRG